MLDWLRRLRELWDIAGQLVELRDEVADVIRELDELRKQISTINERTRKQDYRARKVDEDVRFHESQQLAVPVGDRSAVMRAARAKGLA